MALHFRPDESLELTFTLQEEVAADPGEPMSPVLRHLQGELPDVLSIEESDLRRAHAASASSAAGLNLSWARTHSCCSTSARSPRYVG